MRYFDGVNVGDSVWTVGGVQFTVSGVDGESFKVADLWFNLDGELWSFEELGQILFCQKPDFRLPKRKVTKTGWVWRNALHEKDNHETGSRCEFGEAPCVKVTYEVEE